MQTLRTKSQDYQDKNHKVKLCQIEVRTRAQNYRQPTIHAGQEGQDYQRICPYVNNSLVLL